MAWTSRTANVQPLPGENKRVFSGLRPKKQKPSSTAAEGRTNRDEPVKSFICSNPLDRFAELLLSWKISGEIQSNSIDKIDFPYICDHFETFQEYVQQWEPILIDEIKAGVLNTIFSLRASGHRRGCFIPGMGGKSSGRMATIRCSHTTAAVSSSEKDVERSVLTFASYCTCIYGTPYVLDMKILVLWNFSWCLTTRLHRQSMHRMYRKNKRFLRVICWH